MDGLVQEAQVLVARGADSRRPCVRSRNTVMNHGLRLLRKKEWRRGARHQVPDVRVKLGFSVMLERGQI